MTFEKLYVIIILYNMKGVIDVAKKTFALYLKDGAEVKTLEELQEHFDLDRVYKYFKRGVLL